MNKSRSFSLSHALHWGALEIAGIYLIIGALWILFSDQIAARVALNTEMLAAISLYKGWAYVLITALLLYWLIRRHTAALRASEIQLHRVIDAMPVFISYVGADRRYQFTNKTYQEWYSEATEGKHIEEVIGKAAYSAVSKYIDKVLTGEPVSYETEIPYQGTELFMSIQYIPDSVADGQVKGFFVMAQDRTAQKQTSEELRLWADAFEGCAHGIAIGDPNTNRIVVCNQAFAQLHKSREEHIVGSAILSLFAASDYEHVRRNVQKADQIGHARFEARMIRKDSSIFPVEMDVVSILGEDGEVQHRVVSTQDISERKRAEEMLKDSETKYRTLVEHLPAITYISGPEQYMGVSYISPHIESLGFESNTWIADPDFWFNRIHPDDQKRVTAELQRFQEGGESFKAVYRLILPNGEPRWFHDESIRVKDQSGKTIFKQGFMLDITESKQAEKVLKESEERYRMVSELTSDYAYRDRVEADGAIVPEWITESFARITGYSWDEAQTSELWKKLIYPDDVPALLEHTHIILSGESHTQEMRITTKHGELRWLRDFANPEYDETQKRVVGLYGAVQDITEYKQAEEKVRLQARWLEQINDAVIMSDQDLVITAWNPAAERIYGWQAEEVIGKKGEEVLRSEFFSKNRSEMLRVINERGEFSAEITQLRKDGLRIHIETRSVILRDGSGQPIGHISVNRDITERKQVEEQLERSNQRLNGILESIQDDFYVLDHDWCFVYASKRFTSKVGKEPADFIGKNIWAMFPKHVGTILEEKFRETMDKREVQRFEIGGKYTSAWYRMTVFPSTEGITVLGTDITERKQAEESLRRFELLSEHSRDIILFMGHKDGRVSGG